jgi:hypothetical protein
MACSAGCTTVCGVHTVAEISAAQLQVSEVVLTVAALLRAGLQVQVGTT